MEHIPQNGRTHQNTENELVINPPLLLRNFRQSELREFLASGTIEKYGTGDPIYRCGDSSSTACLLVNGLASIWKENIHLANLKRGDFIGETFLFSQRDRQSDIIAEDEVTVIRFAREKTLDFFRSQPERLFNLFIMNIINLQHQKIMVMDKKIISLQKLLMKSDSNNA